MSKLFSAVNVKIETAKRKAVLLPMELFLMAITIFKVI